MSAPVCSSACSTQQKVIDYWNRAGLGSLDSSTSYSDSNLAYLDNILENDRLTEILSRWVDAGQNCLDVGAGYGRFVSTYKRFFPGRIVLLEPADRIYDRLQSIWANDPLVECHACPLENYTSSLPFDMVCASGILYFYSDHLVKSFISKASSLLNRHGILVIRDFLSHPHRITVPSSFVSNEFCYYREISYWQELAEDLKLQLVHVQPSKPLLPVLRHRFLSRLITFSGLSKLYRTDYFIKWMRRRNKAEVIDSRLIQTVFLVMRAKSTPKTSGCG